jgi:hypothetical protein
MFLKILRKRISFAILMASMLFAIAFSPAFTTKPASARPCFSLLKMYYSDATYSVEVGEQYWPCAGQPTHWGTTSAFMESSTEECGGACNPLP